MKHNKRNARLRPFVNRFLLSFLILLTGAVFTVKAQDLQSLDQCKVSRIDERARVYAEVERLLTPIARAPLAIATDEPAPPVGPVYVTHEIFCADANNYTTEVRFVNATDEPLPYNATPNGIGPELLIPIAPHSKYAVPCKPSDGFSSVSFKADSRLSVYAEYVTPLQTIARNAPLSFVTAAEYLDLSVGNGLESYVVIALADGQDGGWVTVKEGTSSTPYEIAKGAAILVPVYGSAVKVTRGYNLLAPNLPGPESFATFGLVVHDATGAITIQAPAAGTPYVQQSAATNAR